MEEGEVGGGPYFVQQLRDPACAGDLEFCPACAGKFGIRNSKIGEWASFVPQLRDYEGRPKRAGRTSGRGGEWKRFQMMFLRGTNKWIENASRGGFWV